MFAYDHASLPGNQLEALRRGALVLLVGREDREVLPGCRALVVRLESSDLVLQRQRAVRGASVRLHELLIRARKVAQFERPELHLPTLYPACAKARPC